MGNQLHRFKRNQIILHMLSILNFLICPRPQHSLHTFNEGTTQKYINKLMHALPQILFVYVFLKSCFRRKWAVNFSPSLDVIRAARRTRNEEEELAQSIFVNVTKKELPVQIQNGQKYLRWNSRSYKGLKYLEFSGSYCTWSQPKNDQVLILIISYQQI